MTRHCTKEYSYEVPPIIGMLRLYSGQHVSIGIPSVTAGAPSSAAAIPTAIPIIQRTFIPSGRNLFGGGFLISGNPTTQLTDEEAHFQFDVHARIYSIQMSSEYWD